VVTPRRGKDLFDAGEIGQHLFGIGHPERVHTSP
jgi:hypothetical protein